MQPNHPDQRGQVSALMAVVLGLVATMAIGFAIVGAAIVERHGATVAADAAALASTGADPGAGVVADWYRHRGVDLRADGGHSTAAFGAGGARSRAVRGDELRVAPAVVAIVARAEQLLGRPLEPVGLEATTVTFAGAAATHFATVAADLHMCGLAPVGDRRSFELC